MTDDELRKLLVEATPGPWRADVSEKSGVAQIESSTLRDAKTVAEIDCDASGGVNPVFPPMIPQQAANARLIAAAPDLAAEVLQLRERAEAAEAKAEALGREVNIARYGQPDFAWSAHKAVMRDLQGQLEAASERADALEAENARLREALQDIARQKKTDELVTETDVEYADFEGGYDACIDRARAALGDSHA